MAVETLVQPLRGLAIFAGLSSGQLDRIATCVERIVYRPGETLIREDAEADAAILIIAGEALCVSGPAALGCPAALPAGSLLAELGMLTEISHSATVVARTAVRALRIPRSALHEQMARDAALAHHFVDRIAQRLKELVATLREVDQTLAASIHHLPVPTVRALSAETVTTH